MKIVIRRIAVMFLFVAFIGATAPAFAQSGSDSLQQRNQAAFEQWRKSIPDYEKRLYDRVKDVNSRTVVLHRSVWFSALLAIILIPLITVLSLRIMGVKQRGKITSSADDSHADSSDSHTRSSLDKARLNAIKDREREIRARQVELLDQVTRLRNELASSAMSARELADATATLAGALSTLETIESAIRRLESDTQYLTD